MIRARTQPSFFGVFSFATALAVTALSTSSPVRADVPPPDGYVEACTLEKVQTSTSECLACLAERMVADRCEALLAPYCFSKVCQAWGGSAFTEILCRTKGAQVPPVPADTLEQLTPNTYPLPPVGDGGVDAGSSTCLPYTPPVIVPYSPPDGGTPAASEDKGGCSVSTSAATGSATIALLAILGLGLGLVRRRAKRE
jgi:MYXO-CTERM domain-containing protein